MGGIAPPLPKRADSLVASAAAAAQATTAPLKSLAALTAAASDTGVKSEAALTRAANAAGALQAGLGKAGAAAKAAKPEIEKPPEAAKSAWQQATDALKNYAKDLGKGISDTLTMRSAAPRTRSPSS